MSKRDYYEVLGIDKDAQTAQIKSAYRKLALKYHPDRNQGDKVAEDKFKEASEAYEVLSNSEKRGVYDRFGHQGLSGQGFSGFNDVNDIFSSFGSIFEEFFGFGGAGGGGRNSRGADLRYDLELDFEEGVFGTETQIEYERLGECGVCHGQGAKPGSGRKRCETCGGAGQVRRSQGFFSVAMTCPSCRGQGSTLEDPCNNCTGQGQVKEQRRVNVKVPPGVHDGVRLRLSNEGDVGEQGGGAGDLYVVLYVKESESFEREGHDLVLKQPLGIAQATLGCRLNIKTLEEEREIQVPAGTQHGERQTIPGAGIPRLRGIGRGDLHVEFRLRVPKRLTKKQREALMNYAQLSDEGGTDSGKDGFFQRMFGD